MFETNISYILTFTFTTIAENKTVSLADKIKKYKTKKLIIFLKSQNLELSKTAIKILEI